MDIIYQDSRIVVVIKPVGVLAPDEPGGMPELLRRELGTECIRSVHRLDAQVSGLMVYARSSAAAGILSEQIRQGELDKEYLAIVHGEPPERGDLEDLLRRDRSLRKTFVADAPGKMCARPGSPMRCWIAGRGSLWCAFGSTPGARTRSGCSSRAGAGPCGEMANTAPTATPPSPCSPAPWPFATRRMARQCALQPFPRRSPPGICFPTFCGRSKKRGEPMAHLFFVIL